MLLWNRLQRFRKGIAPEEKARILPHHLESTSEGGHDGDYPLSLMVFALDNLAQVESPNQPWLQEISGFAERQHWLTWVEVNPEDAEHHHLVGGDDVWVESERGKARLRCRIDSGIQPGTLRVPFGLGHTAGGRWMKDIGVNPATLVTPAYDDRVGTPNWQTARVRLRKA
jgi:anaerobic selenocysteine-containing dehydrogenase